MKNLSILALGLIAASVPLLAGNPVTPEPSTMLLVGGGIGVMILVGRKIRARQK